MYQEEASAFAKATADKQKKISRYATILVVLVGIAFLLVPLIKTLQAASAPNIFSYQGRLLDANSNPVGSSSANMEFRLYTALTGGTCLWSNDSADCSTTATQAVTLTAGLFSENLGDTGASYPAIADSVFSDNASVYLEVWVGAEQLTPRKQIVAAPYALNADTLDGIDSTDLQLFEAGTNGTYEDDAAVIIGSDVAETLANSGFSLAGNNDLFVGDSIGVEGNIYTDGSIIAGDSNATLLATGALSITPGAALTTAIDLTDTDLTNAISVGTNTILGTTGTIDYTNFDVAATGAITVATGTGIDTNAAGILDLGDDTATTVNIGTTAVTTLNFGASGALTRAINIGTGTGADTIQIGGGGTTADDIDLGDSVAVVDITSADFGVTLTATTADGIDISSTNTSADTFDIDANSLNTGNVFNISATSLTSGDVLNLTRSAVANNGGFISMNDGTDDVIIFSYSGSPNGALTAPRGSISLDYTNGRVYVNTDDGTTWSQLAAGAAAGNTLDEAYDEGGAGAGRSLVVDSGAIEMTGSNAADYTLEVTTSAAGGALYINDTDGTGLALFVDNGDVRFDEVLDLDGSVDFDGTTFDINASQAAAAAINLNASAANAATTIRIDSDGTGASALDLDSDGGIDIDAASTITIDTTNDEIQIVTGNQDMVLTGSADGTAALTITAGDLTLSDGDLTIAGGDFGVTLDAADSASISNAGATGSSGVLAVSQTSAAANVGNVVGQSLALTLTDYADDGLADTRSGLDVTVTNNASDAGTDDNIYGIIVQNLGGAAQADGIEYAIYQAGTTWDYGLFLEDAAYFSAGVYIEGTTNTYFTIDSDSTGVSDVDVELWFSDDGNNDAHQLIFDDGADEFQFIDDAAALENVRANAFYAGSASTTYGDGSITQSDAGETITIDVASGDAAGEDFIITANNLALLATGAMSITPDAALTTAIDLTDTDLTNAISVAANTILGTTGTIDYTNFDVAATGAITVAVGTGMDTNAAGILDLGDDTATTINVGTTAATTLNLGASGALARAINIGTGTGVDTIQIGGGGTGADDIDLGDALADVDITGASQIVAGTGDALTITANAASTWSTSAGDLTIQSAADGTNLVLIGGDTNPDAGEDGNDVVIEAEDDLLVETSDDIDFDPGDDVSWTFPAGGYMLLDGATTTNTTTDGLLDLNFSTSTTTASAFNLALTSVDDDAADTLYGIDLGVTIQNDTTENDTVYGQRIDITNNDTVAAGVGTGLYISANDGGAGAVVNGILIENLQSTDIDLTNGILIQATTADSIATALNVSDDEITTALSVGANTITGTTAVIDFTDFDVSADGMITLAPDGAGNTIGMTLPSASTQGLVIDAATSDNQSTGGLILITADMEADNSNTTGIAIDYEILEEDSGGNNANTHAALDVLATMTSDDGDNLYGIQVADLSGTAAAGDEHAIYQAGTNWDYGLYIEDAGYFDTTLEVNGAFDPDTLDLTPDGDSDAIDITGTNMTSASAIDMDMLNTSGNIIDLAWSAAINAAGQTQGMFIDFGNVTSNGQIVYGLHVNDLDAGDGSAAQYAIYQTGTNWDLGLYVVDDAQFDGNLVLGSANTDTITMNAYVNDDIYVGANAETLGNAGFALNGNDLFVAGMAGIEGDVYTDGAFVAGASTSYGNGTITQSATESLTISASGAGGFIKLDAAAGTLRLNTDNDQTVTIGSGAITQEAAGGQVTLTGNVDASNGLDVSTAALTSSAGTTLSGGEVLVSGGNMQINDNLLLTFGSDDDISMEFDADGTSQLRMIGSMILDADTTDITADALTIDVGTLTDGVDGLVVDFAATGNSGDDADTMSAIHIIATNTTTNQDTDDHVYGLYVEDLGAALDGNEYAIYQAGTTWDYGLRVEDQVYTDDNVELNLSANSDRVVITANGERTTADQEALKIDWEDGDANEAVFYIESDVGSNDELKFRVNSSGTVHADGHMRIRGDMVTTNNDQAYLYFGAQASQETLFWQGGNSRFELSDELYMETALYLEGEADEEDPVINIDTGNRRGTIIDIDYDDDEIQNGAITGLAMDLGTKLTGFNGTDLTGVEVELNTFTQTGAGTLTYTGFDLATAGALTQNTAAGTMNWRGVDVNMPNITETTGTVDVAGIMLTSGTITTGGDVDVVDVVAQGVAAGTLDAINIGSITGGGGTETAIKISSGWDTGIYVENLVEVQDATAGTAGIATGAGDLYVHDALELDGDNSATTDVVNIDLSGKTAGSGLEITLNDSASNYAPTSDALLYVNQANNNASTTANAVNIVSVAANANADALQIDESGATARGILINATGARGATGAEGIYIDWEDSTATDQVFAIESDDTTDTAADTVKFKVTAQGAVYSDANVYGTPADFAEYFYDSTGNLAAGEVVVIDQNNEEAVRRSESALDANVMGVVSTKAAFVSNWSEEKDNDSNWKVIALAGQVPVRVSDENGQVEIGDYLTSASLPGYAMKATEAGQVIGRALQAADPGTDVVVVYVSGEYYTGAVISSDGLDTLISDTLVLNSLQDATANNPIVDSQTLALRGSVWNGVNAIDQNMKMTTVVDGEGDYRLAISNTMDAEVVYVTDEGTMSVVGDMIVGGHLYPSDRGVLQTDKYIYYDGSEGLGGDMIRTNASGWSTGSYDFAEMFPSNDELVAGEVVIFADDDEHMRRSSDPYDNKVAGIVSTKPGFLAGENKPGDYPVALAGRVPVRVTLENGPIKIGDPLTTSSTAGYAMKATEAGPIMGNAMQAFDGSTGEEDVIVAFVNVSYYGGDDQGEPEAPIIPAGGGGVANQNLIGDLYLQANNIFGVASISGISERWVITEAGDLKVQGALTTMIESYQSEDVETVAVLSREHTITLSGTAELSGGMASINFEDVDPQFNDIISTITPVRVMAMAIGEPVTLYVVNQDNDGFTISSSSSSNTEFNWFVTAYRKDYEPEEYLDLGIEEPENLGTEEQVEEIEVIEEVEPVEEVIEVDQEVVDEIVEEPADSGEAVDEPLVIPATERDSEDPIARDPQTEPEEQIET